MKRKLTKIDVFLLVMAFIVVGVPMLWSVYKANKPTSPTVQSAQVAKPVDVPLNADKILELVNAERQKVGVAPLSSDPRLVATAQARVDDMVARNYFAHRDPVTNENMVKALPYCTFNSENIGNSIDLSGDNNQDTVDWWMNSKPHHDAMLDAKYTLTGIAVNGHYSVQHFCQ